MVNPTTVQLKISGKQKSLQKIKIKTQITEWEQILIHKTKKKVSPRLYERYLQFSEHKTNKPTEWKIKDVNRTHKRQNLNDL